MQILAAEVGDDGAAQVLAFFELIQDGIQLRERTAAADVALDISGHHHVDELAHLLHVADDRGGQGRVFLVSHEGVQSEVAFARRGNATRHEQAAGSQHL